MEYLGRLGLVPRKSRKDRETSPQNRSFGEESRALKKDLARVIESGLTCATSTSTKVADFPRPAATTIVDIARLPIPSDCNTTTTTASLFVPARSSSASPGQDAAAFIDDVDYFEYEQHVQAQARAREALFGAPGAAMPGKRSSSGNVDARLLQGRQA